MYNVGHVDCLVFAVKCINVERRQVDAVLTTGQPYINSFVTR